MTSQNGQQMITIHTLPNFSRHKDNQTKKFDLLIKHNVRNIFFENHAENEQVQIVTAPFLKKQSLYKVKAGGEHLIFKTFWQASTCIYDKNKFYNISKC